MSTERLRINLGALLRAFYGPSAPREKTAEEMRWEDDGGPSTANADGYEHFLAVAR